MKTAKEWVNTLPHKIYEADIAEIQRDAFEAVIAVVKEGMDSYTDDRAKAVLHILMRDLQLASAFTALTATKPKQNK